MKTPKPLRHAKKNNKSVNRKIVDLQSSALIFEHCPRKCVLAANSNLTLKIFGFGIVVVFCWVPTRSVQSWSNTYIKVRATANNNITFCVAPLVACPERRYRGAKWIRPPGEKHGLGCRQGGGTNVGQHLRMANGPQT